MQLSEVNPFMRYAQLHTMSTIELSEPHAAYDCRLFYFTKSRGSFVIGDRKYDLSVGDVLFFRPGIFYNFIVGSWGIVLNFDLTHRHEDHKDAIRPDPEAYFRPDLIFENEFPAELEDLILIHNAFDLEPFFHKCISHYNFPNAYSDFHTSALIKEILSILLQKKHHVINQNTGLVEKIMIYLHTNYSKKLTNADISSAFGYHPFYLNRILKENTGMTLHQILLNARIQNAKELLAQTSLSVEDIYKETGFTERVQFNSNFRKFTGMTPLDYRKKARKEKQD